MLRIKKAGLSMLLIFLVAVLAAQSDGSTVMLKTLRGSTLSFSALTQKDSLILICFFACTSDVSINELNAINNNYEKWKSEIHFKMMAVSVDQGKSASRVRPTVNMNGWTFEVYTDINGDLQKTLNSNNLPQSMIIKNGRVIYQQSGYQPGTENYLFQRIKAISEGKE
jgi:hypothetical protein